MTTCELKGLSLRGEKGNRSDRVGVGPHSHAAAELTWVTNGLQTVFTPAGTWVVPSSMAVWVPGGQLHDAYKQGSGEYRWLKLPSELCCRLPSSSCAVHVSRKLAQAAEELAEVGELEPGAPAYQQVLRTFLSEVADSRVPAVPFPVNASTLFDPLLTRILHAPADGHSVAKWADVLGMGVSTLRRRIRDELQMSFLEVRTGGQIIRALEGLAVGDSVADVSVLVGYRSVSMFIQAFRRRLGQTPAQFRSRYYR